VRFGQFPSPLAKPPACKDNPSPPLQAVHSMLDNSVTRLRIAEKAHSRREFLARGGRLQRCPDCLLTPALCICNERPAAAGQVAVCLLYFHGEVYKPSNSGRLVADVLTDNHAFRWFRTEPQAELLALLADPAYIPLIVFPFQYAEIERQLNSPERIQACLGQKQADGSPRKPLMILLDGTWREARKMYRSSWLSQFPVLGFEPTAARDYRLRESFHPHQLGTAEVAVEILRILGDEERAQVLSTYFELFKVRYLAGKPVQHGQSDDTDQD
jgi:DTW domain-containing protein